MMLEILVWFAIFATFMALLLLFNYWIYLFRTQDSFSREEIINVPRIVQVELGRLLGGQDMPLRVLSFLGGIFVAWALTLLGGFLSPDLSPAPDYASDQVPNYFFQSALSIFILHLIWPAFKDMSASLQSQVWLHKLIHLDLPFFLSLSIALGAINLILWGLYHEMHFFYCILNLGLCLSYASYRLGSEEKKLGDAKAEEENPLPIESKNEVEELEL